MGAIFTRKKKLVHKSREEGKMAESPRCIIEDEVLKIVDQDRNEIIAFLRDMVKIPSISGSRKEKEIQDFIADRFSAMDLQVDIWEPDVAELKAHCEHGPLDIDYVDRPNLVGISKGAGGGRSLILNGHIDVVPVGFLERWKTDPWDAKVIGGKMFGRGTADMKGGVAAMIMALNCIKKARISLKGDVIIESVVDEERCGNGSLACVLRGYKADAGIITEPTGLNICPAHAGVNGFRIMVRGKPAHPSKAVHGVSAIEKAMKVYNLLKDFRSIREKGKKHPLFVTRKDIGWVNISKFEGSQEDAVIQGTIRSLPNEECGKIQQHLEEYLRKVTKSDPWLGRCPAQVEWIPEKTIGSSEVPIRHPVVREFKDAYECVMKEKAEIQAAPYGCDARLLTRNAKTPALIFGPGDIAQAHTVDEYIEIDRVIDATKILSLFLLRWCGSE
jgi:acetylornithine deacetylase